MNIVDKERHAQKVSDYYEGICPEHEVFYLQSIIYSSERCLDAFKRYEKFKDKSKNNAAFLISTIQEAVGHSAALSRYFWPSPKGIKEPKNQKEMKISRGMKLRKAFSIDDNSPLCNRELRNAWEHFDEKLDEYLLEHNTGNFFPDCIVGTHTLSDGPRRHIFKLLDINEACLILMGEQYFFTPIREEVERVFNIACNAFDKGGRLPKSS